MLIYSDIPVTETQTDTEMIDISKTYTETNTEKIISTDTTLWLKNAPTLADYNCDPVQ